MAIPQDLAPGDRRVRPAVPRRGRRRRRLLAPAQASGKIAFSPGAVVWHHRRGTVRAYLRQQRGYGKAEALLERKHPEKYSAAGHVDLGGRLVRKRLRPAPRRLALARLLRRLGNRVLPVPLRSAQRPAGVVATDAGVVPGDSRARAAVSCGEVWRPSLLALPLLGRAIAALGRRRARRARARFQLIGEMRACALLTGVLYLLQPLARLYGRLSHGLTPWRRHGQARLRASPASRTAIRSGRSTGRASRTGSARSRTRCAEQGAVVRSGGDWDRWDLQVRGGLLGGAGLRMAVEEHGAGQQLVRVRSWPAPRTGALLYCLIADRGAGLLATSAMPPPRMVLLARSRRGAVACFTSAPRCATATIKRALTLTDADSRRSPSRARAHRAIQWREQMRRNACSTSTPSRSRSASVARR